MRLGVAVSASSQLVCLQAGIVVPLEAFTLALECEALGIRLSAHGGVLDVDGPHTPEILQALRRWKPQIVAILRYSPSDRHLYDPAIPFPEHGPVYKGSNAR